MKYAMIIPDGAADVPLDDLDGKTPLQAADIPNMDTIARTGRVGRVLNIPEGYPAGSDVAILSVLGYDPRNCYTGRAPLEAAAQGLTVAPDEWIFRCNLVTIIEGVMEDYSAGQISTREASALIDLLQARLGSDRLAFYTGVAYRHLVTLKAEIDVTTTPPHDILGQAIDTHLPTGAGSPVLREIMQQAGDLLAGHEINTVRHDLGENPATDIWLWGEGKMPTLETFESRFGLRGSAITAVDLVRGISKLIGWEVIEVEGATGYVETNYAGKGKAAVEALDEKDIVLVHVEATDEAGHNADVAGKVYGLEQIDRHIVGPVLERLRTEGEDWRIVVLPDHPTPCPVRTHTREPVPFAMAGKRIEHVVSGPFCEDTAGESDLFIERGCNLMEFFLTIR